MATIVKRVRVANPRRARRTRNKSGRFVKRSTARRKKNTAKRKKNSGSAIRRYSATTLKKELKRRGHKMTRRNPAKRKARRAKRSNPVLIELGAINPRRKSVAKKTRRRKTRNPRRRRATVDRVQRRKRTYRRRRNPMTRTTVRRRTTVYNRRRRRRNPSGRDMMTKASGVLAGVALTKFLPGLLPSNITGMTSGMGAFAPVLITGAGAFASYWIFNSIQATKGAFADYALAGGLALTLSRVIDMMLPADVAARLSLKGMGDIIPANYVVPQNPVKMAIALPPPAAGNGMGQYRGAYRRA